MVKLFIVIGSLSALAGVALGAFAAHMLKSKLTPELFNVFEVGVRYHLIHALGIFVVAWVMAHLPDANVSLAGWLFVGGITIFSGSLYVLSLTGARWLGALTPVGGLCFLAGWGWLAWRAWKSM